MAYTPRYVSVGEIPVQIPDDYSQQEKLDAIEFAEAAAELDLKDGKQFADDELSPNIMVAIRQKATCELAKGAEHPDDTALTDLSDTGADKADYAENAFCQRYEEIIDKIQQTDKFADEGGSPQSPYVYSTSKPD